MARIILTIVALAVGGFLLNIFDTSHTILSGDLAGLQLQSSNAAALANTAGQSGLNIIQDLLGLLFFGLLVAIWWTPVRKLFSSNTMAS